MSNSRNCSSRRVKVLCVVAALLCSLGIGSNAQQPSAPHGQVIRLWGYEGLSSQLMRWENAYRVAHPDVQFENQMHGAAAVMAGLYDGVADVTVMGREIWPVETMAYRWVYQQQPFGVTVATAGLHGPGQLFTPVVLVNAKNPLTTISLAQLDAIYGSEHRAAPANIRIWGEMGLTAAWTAKPIHAYGYGAEDALGVFFRHDVLKMDFKPNAESHLLSDRDPGKGSAAPRIEQAVAADADAIGYTSQPHTSATRALAVDGVAPTADTLSTHQYPLTRSLWIYFRREPGKPIDPKVEAFVRFLLSGPAQALIQPSDELLPLTPALLQKQVQKLDSPMPKTADAEDKDQ